MSWWIAWIVLVVASFAVLEGVGISTKDRFPTLSKVWIGWEDRGSHPGVLRWTLLRWGTMIGLIALSTYLLLHWVAEVI